MRQTGKPTFQNPTGRAAKPEPLDLYEPFVGRRVEWIIEPETPADKTWRVIADAEGARLECSG
jgi:hypothetical protein